MAKKKSLNTYNKGDKVKVNLSGSGNGYQFLTIDQGFETDNINGYKDYNFEEEPKIKICEYYIRKITKSDVKLHKLYTDLDIENYEIETDDINMDFWKSQEDNIIKTISYLNDFLHPYLNEYKHIVSVDKMMSWDETYKKGMHTKGSYIFSIKHKDLNIIVFKNSTYVTIFITSPYFFTNNTSKKSILGIYDISIKHSGDTYDDDIVKYTELIISKYEENIAKKSSSRPFIHYRPIHDTTIVRSLILKGNSDDWQYDISSLYTYSLKEINYIKHYIFNKGFE